MKKHLQMWASCTMAAFATAIVWAAMINVPATAQVTTPQPNQPNQPVVDRNAPVDQTRLHTNQNSTQAERAMNDREACKASDIIGMEVRATSDDKKIGSINDLMVQHDGKVTYAAVSFGGFLGIGDKLFAVPWDAIHVIKKDNSSKAYAQIDVNEQSLKDRQGFDKDHWPEKGDAAFLTGVQRQTERPLTSTAPR